MEAGFVAFVLGALVAVELVFELVEFDFWVWAAALEFVEFDFEEGVVALEFVEFDFGAWVAALEFVEFDFGAWVAALEFVEFDLGVGVAVVLDGEDEGMEFISVLLLWWELWISLILCS